MSEICIECGNPVFESASEKVRFQQLMKSTPGFFMPKRCSECRRKNKVARTAPLPRPAVVAPAPAAQEKLSNAELLEAFIKPDGAPDPRRVVPAPEKKEIRFVLATSDFEKLVHGQPVVWQGVRVILADIGFEVMRDAIEDAETEAAKKAFHKNGNH